MFKTCIQDFFLPSEAFGMVFLRARIVILCTKGFEVLDLTEYVNQTYCVYFFTHNVFSFKSVTLPHRDTGLSEAVFGRCQEGRPRGLFRVNENEFLFCFDGTLKLG